MTRTIIHTTDIMGQVTVTTGPATATTDIIARTTGTGTMAITMGTAGGITGNREGALPIGPAGPIRPMGTRLFNRRATPVARERAPTGVIRERAGAVPLKPMSRGLAVRLVLVQRPADDGPSTRHARRGGSAQRRLQ